MFDRLRSSDLRQMTMIGHRLILGAASLVVGLMATVAPTAQQTPAVPRGASLSTGFATDLKNASPSEGCTNAVTTPPVDPEVFPTRTGTVTSTDGKPWIVPGPVQEGPLAVDLYNDCTAGGFNPSWEQQLNTVVIDKDGVEITGYIFADNYFELFVNGQFVARDRLAMTPFNSTIVRFRAKYPMTYAIKGIDWETKHGLGMEYKTFNIGDGGFIAYFSDGNGTHADWRAETFYIAPLDDPMCVRTAGGRDSSFCAQAIRPVCAQKDPAACYALHFPVPDNWTSPSFDATAWPQAVIWRSVEVTPYPAYVSNTKFFGDAEFIWTHNIRLDNLVLARYTATGPRQAAR